jgi:hypothetical protein
MKMRTILMAIFSYALNYRWEQRLIVWKYTTWNNYNWSLIYSMWGNIKFMVAHYRTEQKQKTSWPREIMPSAFMLHIL